MRLSPRLSDFVERAGWSGGQAFFATLLAGGSATKVVSLPWKYALILAAGAAVTSILLTEIQYLSHATDLPFWQDLLVRAAKTFLASLAGATAAAHPFNVVTFNWPSTLNLAALAALTSVGKGLLAGGSENGVPVAAAVASPTVATSAVVRRTPSTLPAAIYTSAVRRDN